MAPVRTPSLLDCSLFRSRRAAPCCPLLCVAAAPHCTALLGALRRYACPVVSGVAALMLEARPELTWRDVQGVLAATASDTYDPDDPRWEHNAAGFHHSVKYGFGVVDAYEAVKLAKTWRLWPHEVRLVNSPADHNLAIPEDGTEVQATMQLSTAVSHYILETARFDPTLPAPT